MKKSLYVSFRVIFCPACCNISSDLNKFFAVSDAGGYAEEQSYLLKTKKKVRGTYLVIVLFLVASCIL